MFPRAAIIACMFMLVVCSASCGMDETSDAGVMTCPNDLPADCPMPSPSYAGEVRPIIDHRCMPCHFPGGVAQEKSFVGYDDVHALRRDMLNQIYGCRMPPSDAGQLSEAERAAMLTWFVCGAQNN